MLNQPCFYVTIIVDRINNTVVSFPKVIESYIVDERDDKYIVQASKTNCHVLSVKKEWVFFNEQAAKDYVKDNKELQDACEDAKWWLKNYLKKNKEG